MIKQKAMSILEVLTVVVLTSILVGLSFMVYVNFTKTFFLIDKSTNSLMKVVQFEKIIQIDWHKSKINEFENGMLIMDSVTYEIEEDYILRSGVAVDTFHFDKIEIEPRYIFEGSTNLIDQVSINFEKSSQLFHINLQYQYDAKTLMDIESRY
jgi:hypothetical protein